MPSMAPPNSQTLHNFTFPPLNWTQDGESGDEQNRRRSNKSSPLRPDASSLSPLRNSAWRDSVLHSAAPLSTDQSIIRVDNLGRTPPIQGGSSPRSSSPIPECTKQAVIDQGESMLLSSDISKLRLHSEESSGKKGALIEYRRKRSRSSSSDNVKDGVNSSSSEQDKGKIAMNPNAKESDATLSKRSRLLIRFPCKNIIKREELSPKDPPKIVQKNDEAGEEEDGKGNNNNGIAEETKKWNLRPRKSLLKPHSAAGKTDDPKIPEKSKTPPLVNSNKPGEKGGRCDGCGDKKQKRKLSIHIALTKHEIEEDIFAMTGSKPSRRPKKRSRNVQRQLDQVFPGLMLVSITPESYKVSESSLKG